MERGTYTGIVGWEEGHTLVLLDGKRDTHRYCWMERGTHTGIVGGKEGHVAGIFGAGEGGGLGRFSIHCSVERLLIHINHSELFRHQRLTELTD